MKLIADAPVIAHNVLALDGSCSAWLEWPKAPFFYVSGHLAEQMWAQIKSIWHSRPRVLPPLALAQYRVRIVFYDIQRDAFLVGRDDVLTRLVAAAWHPGRKLATLPWRLGWAYRRWRGWPTDFARRYRLGELLRKGA